ncbi:hypothetical protein Micbo1qcDRAFT_227320 [Microdochium bolleyi]|uniref:Secreted protein n=1 Tax=Microdochium bolleyi TaxID=196109 RepID=A0A136IZG3_9PEZI|nr:hypothetical protein Micbo1qcDRAFT_227320 [Microdochium bolleyi]
MSLCWLGAVVALIGRGGAAAMCDQAVRLHDHQEADDHGPIVHRNKASLDHIFGYAVPSFPCHVTTLFGALMNVSASRVRCFLSRLRQYLDVKNTGHDLAQYGPRRSQPSSTEFTYCIGLAGVTIPAPSPPQAMATTSRRSVSLPSMFGEVDTTAQPPAARRLRSPLGGLELGRLQLWAQLRHIKHFSSWKGDRH